MILKDLSRKVYKRICYSLENKKVLYVGISPKKRDKDLLVEINKRNDLTVCDKELLRTKLGKYCSYCFDISGKVPFKDNTFDAVVMLGVIGYGLDDVKDILKAFKNIKRILKPNGKVYFELTKEKKI